MAPLDVFFSEFGVVEGGGIKHEPGAVHAYFRNGKFIEIVKQGKFAIPVFRRPLIGHIEVIAISTASHEVSIDVRDVLTSDGYLHPTVTVRLQVRLNDEGGYRRVAALLTSEGRNAGAFLSAGVGSLVQSQVKQRVAQLSSDELLRASLIDLIPISLASLADGVVLVTQVTAIDWQRAEAYDKNLRTAADASTLEMTHEVEVIKANHTARIRTIEMETEELARKAEHERQMEVLRTEAVTKMAGAFFESGRASTKDFKEVLTAFAPPPGAALAPPASPAQMDAPRYLAIESTAMTAEQGTLGRDIPTLQMDARLRRLWNGLELGDVVAGCASVQSGSNVGAAFVLTDAPSTVVSVDSLRRLEGALMQSYRSEAARVLLVPLLGTRQNLVENYFAEALKHVARDLGSPIAGTFGVEIEITDEYVSFALGGERAADVRRLLIAPESCLLKPLQDLLALDYVEVVFDK